MNISHIIIRPIITEKAVKSEQSVARTYVFLLNPDAGKLDVKRAILELYNREVDSVRICGLPKKTRLLGKGKEMTKRKERKKAYVRLKGDAPLEVVEVLSTKHIQDKKNK
ncbi:MAG: 50S ribosomal protein L23 [Candidatus Peregrinibacteria bacterium]